MLEFTVVTISVFVSTLNEITKTLVKGVFHKEINRFIPIFSIVYGIGLAILAFYTGIENFGNNLVEAMFIGLSSGAAAVGYHQVGKQLFKESLTTDTTEQKEEEEYPVAEVSDGVDVEDVVVVDYANTEDVEDVEDVPDVEDINEEENENIGGA